MVNFLTLDVLPVVPPWGSAVVHVLYVIAGVWFVFALFYVGGWLVHSGQAERALTWLWVGSFTRKRRQAWRDLNDGFNAAVAGLSSTPPSGLTQAREKNWWAGYESGQMSILGGRR